MGNENVDELKATIKKLERDREYWKSEAELLSSAKRFSGELAECFPDGAVNVSWHREERQRWQARLEDLEGKLLELSARHEALVIEHKHLSGSYKNVLNNYGAAKAKYDAGAAREKDANRRACEALANEQTLVDAIEAAGGRYYPDSKVVSLPTNEELAERLRLADEKLSKANAELEELKRRYAKVTFEFKRIVNEVL